MSNAALRPSPVIFSMLSTDGSTRSFFSFSARSVKRADERLEFRARRRSHYARPAVLEFGPRKLQHIRGLHVGNRAEHRKQLREVDEFRKPSVHPVAQIHRAPVRAM